MKKRGISFLFSIFFLLCISSPAILTMVDDTFEVSLIVSTPDDDESEKNLNFQVLFFNIKPNNSGIVFSYAKNRLLYSFKKYGKPHLDIISPPPDYYTL